MKNKSLLMGLITAMTMLSVATPSYSAAITGTFTGVVMGGGSTHGIVQGVSVDGLIGAPLTGSFSYEPTALTQTNPLIGSDYQQHYQFAPVTPATISLNVLGYTFNIILDGESYVWVGLDYGSTVHSWFEVGGFALDGEVARVVIESFGTYGTKYVSDVADISNVDFSETPALFPQFSNGYLLSSDQTSQLIYQVTSMTVGSVVPEPSSVLLLSLALGGLVVFRRGIGNLVTKNGEVDCLQNV